MSQAKRRSKSSAVSRAKARNRRREKRRVTVRRREIGKIAVLCVLCTLLGGLGGVYLAGDGAGVALPPVALDEAATPPEDAGPVEVSRQVALVPIVDEAEPEAAEEREALENKLAHLYEGLLDPAPPAETPPAETPGAEKPPVENPATEAPPAPEKPRVPLRQEARLATPDFSDVGAPEQPFWQRNAVPIINPGKQPMIAIVLDDLGLNRRGAHRAIGLPAPLTLAFMTYAEELDRMTADARAAGHELMLHMPMGPRSKSHDPGPNVLRTELSQKELARRMQWGLGRFEHFVGVNNHMGSRFTTSPKGMAQVMRELRTRGLLFLDSVTSGGSVGAAMARRAGVPYAQRDVFLDNEWNDRGAIRRQLKKLETVARRRGYAVGIGHPHRATLDVLAEWLPKARARGFALVPISAIVRHRFGIAQDVVQPTG
ncbi:MAG: divergent polysaccharide deacetylase family protein [Kiloniellales bacterium]